MSFPRPSLILKEVYATPKHRLVSIEDNDGNICGIRVLENKLIVRAIDFDVLDQWRYQLSLMSYTQEFEPFEYKSDKE